jgi:hypothetical protein
MLRDYMLVSPSPIPPPISHPLDTIEIRKPDEWVFKRDSEDQPTTLTPMRPVKKRSPAVWIILLLLLTGLGLAGYYFLFYKPSHPAKEKQDGFNQTADVVIQEKKIVTEEKPATGEKPVTGEKLVKEEKGAGKIDEYVAEQDAKRKEEEREKALKQAAAKRKAEHERVLKKKDDDAFKEAYSRNAIYSFEKYLQSYPAGLHVEEATKRLNQLKGSSQLETKIKDDVAFETASKTNTIASYQGYLKQFPYGNQVGEAKARIAFLKQKMVKETKIKLEVVSIKFFESGSNSSPMEQRKYATRFSKDAARYIFTELKYKNKLYGIAPGVTRVTLEYSDGSGSFRQPLKGIVESDIEIVDGIYSRGIGFTEPGKWQPGSYTVTIYLDDTETGKSHFEVY